ncbi:hypothetical protein CXG81DRAFT_18896 [Caulochytrium protostelioides]|uniref:Uncharacterized protein n=1 Tax=Caulochytrium protostelioides TaxID=1555241 RepID=A0A4P9X7N7_9FUNG|nr:hypothetical protein CXG81DRAFT_18896 [Caulochytrium protostelioides]|eukprot:RKP01267.1 hypothetical protein CXG81DRAFT_18896 [Caulochytrium protostelioides]
MTTIEEPITTEVMTTTILEFVPTPTPTPTLALTPDLTTIVVTYSTRVVTEDVAVPTATPTEPVEPTEPVAEEPTSNTVKIAAGIAGGAAAAGAAAAAAFAFSKSAAAASSIQAAIDGESSGVTAHNPLYEAPIASSIQTNPLYEPLGDVTQT